ncbi:hypothetical protein QUB68_14995 [Microcoleus sp. A006_D1]|uniref:hypothetical protein n=1 Tax=Microcoleus sp. A006_D1 TaxID=3055267 RepID=UPI002FCF0C6F
MLRKVNKIKVLQKQGRGIGKTAQILPNAGCRQNSVAVKSQRLRARSPPPQFMPQISAFSEKTQPLGIG